MGKHGSPAGDLDRDWAGKVCCCTPQPKDVAHEIQNYSTNIPGLLLLDVVVMYLLQEKSKAWVKHFL